MQIENKKASSEISPENELSSKLAKIKKGIKKIILGLTLAATMTSCVSEANSSQGAQPTGTEGAVPAEKYDYYAYLGETYGIGPEETMKLVETLKEMELKEIKTADIDGYYYELKKPLELKSDGLFVKLTEEKIAEDFSIKFSRLAGVAFNSQTGEFHFLTKKTNNHVIVPDGSYIVFIPSGVSNEDEWKAFADLNKFIDSLFSTKNTQRKELPIIPEPTAEPTAEPTPVLPKNNIDLGKPGTT